MPQRLDRPTRRVNPCAFDEFQAFRTGLHQQGHRSGVVSSARFGLSPTQVPRASMTTVALGSPLAGSLRCQVAAPDDGLHGPGWVTGSSGLVRHHRARGFASRRRVMDPHTSRGPPLCGAA